MFPRLWCEKHCTHRNYRCSIKKEQIWNVEDSVVFLNKILVEVRALLTPPSASWVFFFRISVVFSEILHNFWLIFFVMYIIKRKSPHGLVQFWTLWNPTRSNLFQIARKKNMSSYTNSTMSFDEYWTESSHSESRTL